MPGFIDGHTHLFFTQLKNEKHFEDALVREAQLDAKFRKDRAKLFLKEYLKAGFTAVVDLGNSGNFLDCELRNEILEEGAYPQLFVSGPGIASNKAQFAKDESIKMASKEYTLVDEHSDIDSVLEKYLSKNVDILKIYLDNSPGTGELDLRVLEKIFKFKKISQFKKITFHSFIPFKKNSPVLAKIKSLEHLNYLQNWKQFTHLEFVTVTDTDSKTLNEFNYYWPVSYKMQLDRLKALNRDPKIKIVFGSDFYFHSESPGFNRAQYVLNSIDALKEGGLTANQILKSLTINAALSLKMADKMGTIKEKTEANLVGVVSNPLEDINAIKHVVFVMKKGTVIPFE